MIVYLFLDSIIVVIVVYLFAIMPKMLNRPNLDHFKAYYFAHRGLHQEKSKSPENSLEAFDLAMRCRYGIELDVQLSKDHVPVVFHDYSLKRVCGVEKKVCDLTYDELRELNLYSSTEKIPHLREVLALINGKVPLIIELKIEGKDISLCSVIASLLDDYKGVYCIESFNPLGLIWFKKNRPKVVRGQLSSHLLRDEKGDDKYLYFVLQNLLLNFLTKPDFVAFNYKYRNMFSFLLCCNLYKVPAFAWTVDSKEALEESRECFEFFIFEGFLPKENSL